MDKLNFRIELDNILTPSRETLFDWYNSKHNASYDFNKVKEHDLLIIFNIQRPELIKNMQEFYNSDEFRLIKPYEEAVELIKIIKPFSNLNIVVERPNIKMLDSISFIEEYFGKLKNTRFTNPYDPKSVGLTKNTWDNEWKIDLVVEHVLSEAMQAKEDRRHVILLNKPYNQSEEVGGIIRVNDHKEMLEKIMDYRNIGENEKSL